jgi:hypothetical protein
MASWRERVDKKEAQYVCDAVLRCATLVSNSWSVSTVLLMRRCKPLWLDRGGGFCMLPPAFRKQQEDGEKLRAMVCQHPLYLSLVGWMFRFRFRYVLHPFAAKYSHGSTS